MWAMSFLPSRIAHMDAVGIRTLTTWPQHRRRKTVQRNAKNRHPLSAEVQSARLSLETDTRSALGKRGAPINLLSRFYSEV